MFEPESEGRIRYWGSTRSLGISPDSPPNCCHSIIAEVTEKPLLGFGCKAHTVSTVHDCSNTVEVKYPVQYISNEATPLKVELIDIKTGK